MERVLAGVTIELKDSHLVTQTLQEYCDKMTQARHGETQELRNSLWGIVDLTFLSYVPFECHLSIKQDLLIYASEQKDECWKFNIHMAELLKMLNIVSYCSNIVIDVNYFTIDTTYEDDNGVPQNGKIYDTQKLMELYDLMFFIGGQDFIEKYYELNRMVNLLLKNTIKQEFQNSNSILSYVSGWVDKLNKHLPAKDEMSKEVQSIIASLDGKSSIVNKVLKYLTANAKSKASPINFDTAEKAISNIADMIDKSDVKKSKKEV